MSTDVNITERNLTDKQKKTIPLVLGAKTIREGIEKARISARRAYQECCR